MAKFMTSQRQPKDLTRLGIRHCNEDELMLRKQIRVYIGIGRVVPICRENQLGAFAQHIGNHSTKWTMELDGANDIPRPLNQPKYRQFNVDFFKGPLG